jgi:two-component system chemotaxis response regulator CheB
VVAPGGAHLRIERAGGGPIARLVATTGERPFVPSVDLLFESAAEALGGGVLGVVLTGMGDDGTRGAARIRAAGGRVFGEAEESCVIFGMPRALHEAGLADRLVPLDGLPRAIVQASLPE